MLVSFFVYHYVALAGYFLFSAALLLALAQPASAQFRDISFSSVSQCGPFSLNFTGGKAPDALPLTLTVVPFNSTPLSIALPDDSWNQTSLKGAAFTFLPLPAGQEFVVSLDDADGNPMGLVSDIIEVGPSDATDCLPTGTSSFVGHYTIQGELGQCEPFNLTYDFNTVFPDPIVRAFQPNAQSYYVNLSAPDPVLGTSVYTMDGLRDTQIVMMFNDTRGYLQATSMLPIEGNTLSSSACIPNVTTNALSPDVQNASTAGSDSSSSPAKLSTVAIIVIAAGGGTLLAAVVIGVAIWYCCRRRKAANTTASAKRANWEKLDSEKGFIGSGIAQPSEKSFGSSGSRSRTPESRAPTPFWPAVQESTDRRESVSEEMRDGYVKNPPYTASSLETMTLSSPRSFGSVLAEMPRARTQGGSRRSSREDEYNDNGTSSNPFDGDSMSDISSFAMSPDATPTLSSFPTRQSKLPPMPPIPAEAPPKRPPRPARNASLASSLASVEIEHILEMAKLYSPEGGPAGPAPRIVPMPTLTPPPAAAMSPATPRSLNTLLTTPYTGQLARPLPVPTSRPPSIPALSPRPSIDALRSISPVSSNVYRGPPLAPMPLSPLPAGFSPIQTGGMRRSAILSMAGSEYGGFSEETLEAFQILRPPAARRAMSPL